MICHVALRVFTLAFAVGLFTGTASAQSSIHIPFLIYPDPAADVGFREHYGQVTYKVDFAVDSGNPQTPPDPKSVENSLQSFLRNKVRSAFGGEEGNYVLTLSLLSGSTVVAKKAILSFSWSESRFLFFTQKSSLTGNLSRSGLLTNNFPVGQANNLLNVQLRLQKNQSGYLSTDTFNAFSEQASLMSFKTLQPALELLPSVKTAIGVMERVLNSNEEVDISNDVALRFLNQGIEAPTKIRFRLRGPKNRSEPYFKNGIDVTVAFTTEDSLFNNFSNGSFTSVDLATTLPFSVVGARPAAIPFEDALNSRGYETIRTYLATLQSGTFPSDATPNSVCRELWDTLTEFFTINDAPLIFAAYLRRFDFELDVPGAKRQCLDRYKPSFSRLKIPTELISISQ